ncbi:hypothetical protein ACOQFO_06855 [Ureibacillus sp. MALMAid1270]|uniref:hypothetical protein n=1 Tax=Ureibacillus sp. MALMAid1270 TaxID=3411629 RepID=UPI003BA5CDBD
MNLQEALVKAYGFTIDFERYRNANEQEYPEIYFDGDFVYLMSADYPGFNGEEEPIILSIEQFEDYDSTPLTKDERKSYLENLSSNK